MRCNEVWDEVVPILHEYIAIANVSPVFDPDWRTNGHMAEAVALIAGWCRGRPIPGISVEVVELEGRTPVILVEVPATGSGIGRRHGPAVRASRQAAGDGGLARGPRSVDAGPGGRPAVRPRWGRRRLLSVRRADGDRGSARCRWLARQVCRADRGERGVGFPRPARLRRCARRSHRYAEPGHLPRLGLHRLRPLVGDHVVARSRVGHAHDRHRHRRPAFRRRGRHGALHVPYRVACCSIASRTWRPARSCCPN